MEKNIYRIKLRVFFKDDENLNDNYNKLMPFDELELENIDVVEKNSEGLLIREVIITKNRLCNKFFKNLLIILGSEKQIVLSELDKYIDDDYFDFYLRLDKETLKPVTGGNCFHIKITPAAFPKTKENVREKMTKMFNGT